jgi:hypothetical protein
MLLRRAHGATAAGMMLRDSGRIMLQVRAIAIVFFAPLELLICLLIVCTITLQLQLIWMFMLMNMILMLIVTNIVALGAALLHCGCVHGGRGRRQ